LLVLTRWSLATAHFNVSLTIYQSSDLNEANQMLFAECWYCSLFWCCDVRSWLANEAQNPNQL